MLSYVREHVDEDGGTDTILCVNNLSRFPQPVELDLQAYEGIRPVETFGATVQALKAGDVDVVLTDGTAGKGYVDASNGGLKLIGGPLGTEDFGFIFTKGSDLVAPVNAAIAALKADGTIDALNKKWFLDYKMGQ